MRARLWSHYHVEARPNSTSFGRWLTICDSAYAQDLLMYSGAATQEEAKRLDAFHAAMYELITGASANRTRRRRSTRRGCIRTKAYRGSELGWLSMRS